MILTLLIGNIDVVDVGMMHSDVKVQRQPLLIVPVGHRHNSLFKLINHKVFTPGQTIRNIIAAGDSFISSSTKPVNVMKVIPISPQNEDTTPKTYKSVYSSVGLSFGPYRDVLDQTNLDKYWYFGPLKKLFITAKASVGYRNQKIALNVKWTEVCEGCRLCKEEQIKAAKEQMNSRKRSLWGGSTVNKEMLVEANKVLKFEKVENRKCAVVRSRILTEVDHVVFRPFKDGIEISIATDSTTADFFTTSLRRFRDSTAGYMVPTKGRVVTINCKEVWVEPALDGSGNTSNFPSWFSLDNENFEAVPFYAKFCRDQVNVYKT